MEDEMYDTKICVKCKEIKPKSLFCKDKRNKDGITSKCKDCSKLYSKSWYQENIEKCKNNARIHVQKNPNKHKANCRAWRLANLERAKIGERKWRLNNSGKLGALDAKRRAKKLKATPEWANTEFEQFVIQEIYALAKLRTKITGIVHHVDHIVPLVSESVQGFHCLANLQILEEKENIKKGNRIWPNMP